MLNYTLKDNLFQVPQENVEFFLARKWGEKCENAVASCYRQASEASVESWRRRVCGGGG